MVPSKRCQAALRTTEVIMKLALVICLARVNSRNSCLLPPTLSFVISRPPPLPPLHLIASSPSAALSFAFLLPLARSLPHLFYLFSFLPTLFSANRRHPPSFLPHLPSLGSPVFSALLPSSSSPTPPPCFFPSSLLPHSLGTLTPSDCSTPRLSTPTPPVKKLSTWILNIITSILHIYCAALGCLSPQGENNIDVWGGGGRRGMGWAGVRRRPPV